VFKTLKACDQFLDFPIKVDGVALGYRFVGSGVSMQNGAHGKVEMCALFKNLNIRCRHNFYETKL